MARNKADVCIFCGEQPCCCSSQKKAAPTRKQKKPPTPPPVVKEKLAPKVSVRDAMRSKAKEKPRPDARVHDVSDDHSEFATAIRALEPLLHPDEKERFSHLLARSISPSERAAAWKARRNVKT